MRVNKTTLLISFLSIACYALLPASARAQTSEAFEKITAAVKEYRIDTSAVPDDKKTRKIIALREAKGGFNINEAIQYKLGEEIQKKEKPADELQKMATYFNSGAGKQQLDNAIIWIYRNTFSYKELKHLVKFYTSKAGQKMSANFPVIMLESLAAAEIIQKKFSQAK